MKDKRLILGVFILVLFVAGAMVYKTTLRDRSWKEKDLRIQEQKPTIAKPLFKDTPPGVGNSPEEAIERLLISLSSLTESFEPVVLDLRVQKNWGVASIGYRHKDTKEFLAAGPGAVLLKKEVGRWYAINPGTERFKDWLEAIPESFIPEDTKKFIRYW